MKLNNMFQILRKVWRYNLYFCSCCSFPCLPRGKLLLLVTRPSFREPGKCTLSFLFIFPLKTKKTAFGFLFCFQLHILQWCPNWLQGGFPPSPSHAHHATDGTYTAADQPLCHLRQFRLSGNTWLLNDATSKLLHLHDVTVSLCSLLFLLIFSKIWNSFHTLYPEYSFPSFYCS